MLAGVTSYKVQSTTSTETSNTPLETHSPTKSCPITEIESDETETHPGYPITCTELQGPFGLFASLPYFALPGKVNFAKPGYQILLSSSSKVNPC